MMHRMAHTMRRQSLTIALANFPLLPSRLRARALKSAGVVEHGRNHIYRNCTVQGHSTLTLAGDVFVNYGCYFDTAAEISIGRRVYLSDHVRILTSSHEIGGHDQRAGTNTSTPVSIGDGTWIGSGTVILPGVTIGAGCIIGANSLVTRDCAPNSLLVGSPAHLVRELS